MGDILSQDEIDQLLSALNNGELDADDIKQNDEKKIKNYDFARPSKFSKDHLRTLEIIFEHFGRMLATELTVHLRKTVQVDVMNSEAVTYSEFSNALSNPVVLGIVEAPPLQGNLLIEVASNIAFAMVDRMLGGSGVSLARMRDFSEIEVTIIEKILTLVIGMLDEPWKAVVDMAPRLARVETNAQFAQIISPTEMTAIITMNIVIGDVKGLMNICVPYMAVESIVDKLNTKYWYSTMRENDDNSYQDAIETLISKSKIPIKAVLGTSHISVMDFGTLQVGDIIKIDKKVNEELSVYVGNIKKFTALPGASGDKYAVRITSVCREEQ